MNTQQNQVLSQALVDAAATAAVVETPAAEEAPVPMAAPVEVPVTETADTDASATDADVVEVTMVAEEVGFIDEPYSGQHVELRGGNIFAHARMEAADMRQRLEALEVDTRTPEKKKEDEAKAKAEAEKAAAPTAEAAA